MSDTDAVVSRPQGEGGRDTTDTEREKAQRMYDEDPLAYAIAASDYGWSEITGMCGGCGRADCHDGPCPRRGAFGKCGVCPEREAQGWWLP